MKEQMRHYVKRPSITEQHKAIKYIRDLEKQPGIKAIKRMWEEGDDELLWREEQRVRKESEQF